jgi:hypothetical protein
VLAQLNVRQNNIKELQLRFILNISILDFHGGNYKEQTDGNSKSEGRLNLNNLFELKFGDLPIFQGSHLDFISIPS